MPMSEAPDYERIIIEEVAEVTGMETVTPEDSFLETGGDSLKAILLASAIEERLGIVIDLVDIVQSESFRKLSQLVAAAADESNPGPIG
jgi:phthiocerol/phenolphthiocerol synthesis type-I polyketide synthase E